MQDIYSIGRGGGGGGGDRRLRPYHHHKGNGPPALKCPRCESLNTKFCYYNNYNLSQPRHFCKSCRRYWTKGGVLRNVPVGGGCRKKNRSKPKSGNRKPSSGSGVRKPSNSQNSSSDSCSLTATTMAASTTETTTGVAPVTVAEVLSGINSTNSATTSLHFDGVPNPSFGPPLLDHHNIFAEIDTLITSSTAQLPLEFNISAGISPFRLHDTGKIMENEQESYWIPTKFSDVRDKITDGGLCTEDWNNCTDQELFDLSGTVDQSYWNQTHCDDHNHHDDDLNYLR